MNAQQQHEMFLEKTYQSGEEEWFCPTCGRRMLINWEPAFKKNILEVGDDYASHRGGKGGLRIGSMQARLVDVLPAEGEHSSQSDDFRLKTWQQWLDKINFENLWDDKT